MPSLIGRLSGSARRISPGTVIFFLLFYLYVWLRIDPSLLYFWASPVLPAFSLGSEFRSGFLVHPGGPVEYAAAFLSQFYYYPWAGSLVITAAAMLMWASSRSYLKPIVGPSGKLLHFVPAVLFLMLYNRYDHALALGLAFVLAVWGACLYVQSRRLGSWVRLPAFLVLLGLVYYAGAGASLLYALLCGLMELAAPGGVAFALLCFAAGAVVPWLARRAVCDVTPAEAYVRLLPLFHPRNVANAVIGLGLGLGLCLSLALIAAAAVIWRWARRGKNGLRPRAIAQRAVPARPSSAGLLAKGFWAPAALFLITAVVVWLSFETRLNGFIAVESCARLEEWDKVLERARQIHARNRDPWICYDVNRALFHTRRLPDEMFSYYQHPAALLFPPPKLMDNLKSFPFELVMKFSDIFYELGRVNESEHMAYEVFTWTGNRPMVLKRLAMINIIKERPAAARDYLLALEKDLIDGRWARDCLSRLGADPSSAGDEDVRRIRSLVPAKDDVKDIPVEAVLEECLQANKSNRMAFEYLMGHLLLNRRLDEAVRNLPRLSDFDYVGVPRSYEEAVLIYQLATGHRVDLHGRSISPQTMERFRGFYQIINSYRGNLAGARQALVKDYEDTYFYYYVFGPVGVGT